MQDHTAADDSPVLRMRLFGVPGIEYGGQELQMERVQNRALVYRLAVELQPVGRGELAFLFWPDVSDGRAQRLLTQLLSHVRRALPEGVLAASKTHVGLERRAVWSDAAVLLGLSRSAKTAATGELKEAIGLYGGPLLEGVTLGGLPEYEAWLAGERARCERQYLESVWVLLERSAERGEHAAAVEYGRRYLAVDELAEEVHRRLIESYAALGNRAGVEVQYGECVRVLERELGVPPLPETVGAYRKAQAVRPVAVEGGERAEPQWGVLPGPHTPLVGREEVLSALKGHFAEAQEGRGQVVLLSGEAGIGKTRLMQEFVRSVGGEALVLAAACRQSTQSIPYQPLVDALTPAVQRPELRKWVPGVWLRQAAALFPGLEPGEDLAGSKAVLAESILGRSVLFEAFHQLTAGLAAAAPVLLCLDDLQWADTATLAWLDYIAARISPLSLLICATLRSDEQEGIAGHLWELKRLHICTEYTVAELQVADIRRILEHLEVTEAATLAVRLRAASGGNPFLLLQTVQSLLETGQLTGGEDVADWLPLAHSVREAMRSRFARLQPLARQVLEAAAVLGSTFAFADVQQTAGRSEFETLDGLEELVRRRLILDDSDVFSFNHELTRAVAYQELDYWRRQLLHRRAAETLEKQLRGLLGPARASLVAQLAHHFEQAQDDARAVAYLLEAGDYARNLYQHASALALYNRALAFQQRQGEQAHIARTFMKIGQTQHTSFAFDAAREAFEAGFHAFQLARSAEVSLQPPSVSRPLRVASCFPPPTSWDPAAAATFEAFILLPQLFGTLLAETGELDLVPELAERWEVLDGGRKYVMHLVPDALWSDGMPLTAHDFVYAWRRMLDPAINAFTAGRFYPLRGARAYNTGQIADPASVGVLAQDDHTLVIKLEEPTGHFLQLLTLGAFAPVPRHVLEPRGGRWMAEPPFVSNGPFVLDRWEPEGVTVLRRNPHYHGVFSGNVREVHYYSSTNWEANLRMYERGELDVLSLRYPPTPFMDRVRRRFEAEHVAYSLLVADILGFDTRRPPFDDSRVRQAFAHAVDKETLATVVHNNFCVAGAGGLIPPAMPGHIGRAVLPFDPGRAQRLLAAAGYPNGRGFPKIEWVVAEPAFTPVAEYLRQQWRRVLRVDIPVQATDWTTFFSHFSKSSLSLWVVGWGADYPDPDACLSDGPIQQAAHYDDEVFTSLLADARAVLDQQTRIEAYRQLDRLVCEEAVIVPLTYGRMHMLVKPSVAAFPFSPLVFWRWKDVVLA